MVKCSATCSPIAESLCSADRNLTYIFAGFNQSHLKMKLIYLFVFAVAVCACAPATTDKPFKAELTGTWQLIDALQIRKDSTVHTNLPGTKMIKIINESHFAFLNHDLQAKNDSTQSDLYFVAGGGPYALNDHRYTEHLEYCSARAYEGNDFSFDLEIRGDTLIQKGVEALKDLGIGDENVQIVEIYLRISTKPEATKKD